MVERWIKNGSEDKEEISQCCLTTLEWSAWIRDELEASVFMNRTAPPQITVAKTHQPQLFDITKQTHACFDKRDGHSATYFKTEETLVEHADKVEILHDNDMYSFPYANMCKSNSDKRTE
jgi:hypothetical protein